MSMCTVKTANIKHLGARIALLIWVGLALTSIPAQAMMHPMYYQEARDEATAHVQMEITDVSTPDDHQAFGDCRVKAVIKRVFTDRSGQLKPAMPIQTDISCIVDPKADMPVGGTLWTDYDALKKGVVMETFLNPDTQHPGTWDIPLDQTVVIPHLSKTPQCTGGTPGFRCPE